MRVLDLFSGIGGFSLGLERAGMETVAFCEIEEFPRSVLNKHWPDIPIASDVCKLSYENGELNDDGKSIYKGTIDVVCGGFPCQDLSAAGKQGGINAERSGLWWKMLRIISEIRPKYVIVENVTALLSGERGDWFRELLRSIFEIGYDAEWHCLRASTVGLPHARDRIWVVAYPNENRRFHNRSILSGATIAKPQRSSKSSLGESDSERILKEGDLRDIRKDDGVSEAVDRLGAIGNAVVPQIPEIIGRAIMEESNE